MNGKNVYQQIKDLLDEDGTKYVSDDEKLSVQICFQSEVLEELMIVFLVDDDLDYVTAGCPLGINVPEDKRVEGAILSGAANVRAGGMASISYDISDGTVLVTMVEHFHDSVICDDVYRMMIGMTSKFAENIGEKLKKLIAGEDMAELLAEYIH